MTRIVFLAALFLAGQANAQPAPPGPKCQERMKLLYELANKYLEAPIFRGLDKDGQMLEVFANPKTGTWTVTRTAPIEAPKMQTCVMTVGEMGELIPYETGDPA
jgi:hypothetical protein